MISSLGVMVLGLALAEVQPETYVVQAGDTCASISLKVFGDAKRYDELHRYNQLGPLPHNLKPGQVLRLRPAGAVAPEPTGPDATLTFLKPAVRTRHLLDWNPASLGMSLFRLDEVNTLKGAGAELTFRDASWLLLEENALIVVYGENSLERRGPRGVALVDGELRLALSALRQAPLAVKTRSAEVAVDQRGQGVVGLDGSQTSRLSLFEGQAVVSAEGKQVKVQEDHGTRVALGQAPEAQRQLPARPVLEGAPAKGALWRGGGASVSLSWAPAERAVEYRVQLARDEKFVDRVLDARTREQQLEAPSLEVGHYLARVIAYDEAGLQSRPATPLPVEVLRVEGQVGSDGKVWLEAGRVPAVQTSAGATVLLDGQPPSGQPATVGTHQLELRVGTAAALITPLEVYPRPPEVTRGPKGLVLTFADALPGAEGVEVSCGEQKLAGTALDAHRVAAAAPAGQGSCTVAWRGRTLSAFDVR